MFKNYIKIYFRNLKRNKIFIFINIFGLSLGIAVCLLIFLFIQQEYSHEDFHKKSDRIFRVVRCIEEENGIKRLNALQPDKLAAALRNEYPSVVQSTAYLTDKFWIKHRKNSFEQNVGFVDPGFLKIFSFPLLAGNFKKVLQEPNSIVITEKVARKIFRNSDFQNIIGQTLTLPTGKQREFTITGILKNIPNNSSLQFDVLIPFEHHVDYGRHRNSKGFYSVYIETKFSEDARSIENNSVSLIERLLTKEVKSLHLQPLTDIYFNEQIHNYYELKSKPIYSKILGSIAFLVLFIACLNFMMLSLGRSSSRKKEVGIRKVIGARRNQLIQQFWSESIILSILALGAGILLTKLFLPSFSYLIQKQLSFSLLNNWYIPSLLFCLVVFIGIIIGSYPAIVLSQVKPGTIIGSKMQQGGKNSLKNVLVLLQFAISISLIISTIIILKQTNFLRAKTVGFDKEHILSVKVPDAFAAKKTQLLKEKLLQYPGVINVTVSDRNFIQGRLSSNFKNKSGNTIDYRWLRIDPDYLKTFAIDLINGQNLSKPFTSNNNFSVLVNESFVKAANWDTVIGKVIPGVDIDEKRPFIVGIIRDFHFDSMREKVQPLVLHMHPEFNSISVLFIRIQPAKITKTISNIRKVWDEVAPGYPFLYSFLEKDLDMQYKDEDRWNKIIAYASLLAIIISTLGLWGLASLIMSAKVKEIGIRKILGASMTQILSFLSTGFIGLLLIANLIAWPIVWYIMSKWIQNFAYRIDLTFMPFALAGFITFVIVLLTVSWQTIRAASANPIEVLRNK